MLTEAGEILYGDTERRQAVISVHGPILFPPGRGDDLLSADDKQTVLTSGAQPIYEAAEKTEEDCRRRDVPDFAVSIAGYADWELRLLASELTELAVEDEAQMTPAELIDTLDKTATVGDALAHRGFDIDVDAFRAMARSLEAGL